MVARDGIASDRALIARQALNTQIWIRGTMEDTGCTLSVVLPNYNHARFLPTALNAILTQTRGADEIIVIDDASTDESVAVVERIAAQHRHVRLVRNPVNLGVVRNMNRGLEMARGTFLFYASADDVVHPDLFEKGLALLEAHPAAALFSSPCNIISPEGRTVGALATPLPLASPGYIPPANVRRHLLEDDAWFTGTGTIWSRQHLRDIGGFPEELGPFSDGFVCRQLALMHGTCFSPEVLSSWRRMEGGYAWRLTTLELTRSLIELVHRRMEACGDVFPEDYAERWGRRHMFGVKRFGLVQNRNAARSAGLLPWLMAWSKEVLLSCWYFMTLRPMDTFAVLRRRWRWSLR